MIKRENELAYKCDPQNTHFQDPYASREQRTPSCSLTSTPVMTCTHGHKILKFKNVHNYSQHLPAVVVSWCHHSRKYVLWLTFKRNCFTKQYLISLYGVFPYLLFQSISCLQNADYHLPNFS